MISVLLWPVKSDIPYVPYIDIHTHFRSGELRISIITPARAYNVPTQWVEIGEQAKVTRILGIDLGDRRIGIAISTPEGRLAVPLRILDTQDFLSDARAIKEIAQAEDVERLVLGHPLSMDGKIGAQARKVDEFAQTLRDVTGLPVDLRDERLSTAQARRSVKKTRETRKPVDDIAAAVILQSYLDGASLSRGSAT